MPPTRNASDRRSSACSGERTGGQANSFGITDQSLASTIGTSAMPIVTCRPCVAAYSHDGDVGHANR